MAATNRLNFVILQVQPLSSGHVLLVALAAICWGVSGGIGGLLLARGWDPWVASLNRGVIGLLFVLVWLTLRPTGSGLTSRRLWIGSTIAGAGVAGNFGFYFVSIAEGSVSVAATLMYSAPVFVYLASFALKLERPTAPKWAAIAVAMIGMGLLTQIHNVQASGVTPVGVGAGLLAGLSYAVFIFGFKYAAPHGSPQAILSIAFTVLALILCWPSGIDRAAAALSTPDWPLFAGLGLLGAGWSFALYIIGLRQTAPAVASIVAMVEPVTASLLGVVWLQERLANLQILGMVLILVTATALSVHSSSQPSPSDAAGP